jgi:DNA (cytosine-5)-methyltransferase 1
MSEVRIPIQQLITGPWYLKDIDAIPKNGLNVFSTFSCGGGSTMGYKLAGYNVIGCVEIDKEMFELYSKNHNPKYGFNLSIDDFNKKNNSELPEELFNLDILDGSPPCSSFSMAGLREESWGKETYFREGQSKQVLDDLFFSFLNTVEKLQPKCVVAENVKGLIMGKAKGYCKLIINRFNQLGYTVKLFLLNSSLMGVPQKRERVFFIAFKNNTLFDNLDMNFNEPIIKLSDAIKNCDLTTSKYLTEKMLYYWKRCLPGDNFSKVHPKKHLWNTIKLHQDRPAPTVTSTSAKMLYHYNEPRTLSDSELIRLQSFPEDYNFYNSNPGWVMGMSVPPLMMQRIALKLSNLI